MLSLILTVILLICIYALQKYTAAPAYIAGLLAVIPIKIIGTAMISIETGGKTMLISAIQGILIGQFIWGVTLLGVWLWLWLK